MQKLPLFLNANRPFFVAYGLFFVTVLIFCICLPRSEGFLWVDGFHSPFFDNFFVLVTNLGNGFFFLFVIGYFLMRKSFRRAGQLVIVFLVTTILVQLCKYGIHEARPKTFFEGHRTIHLLAGITHSGFSSFPSGHTATIFSLAAWMAFYTKQKYVAASLILPAVITAYSRVYLSQHFPVDILVGSLIGVGTSSLVFYGNWTFPIISRSRSLASG